MIGTTIVNLLEANSVLMALVPSDRIFPYIANEKTPLPLIVYMINSNVPEYTKGISVAQTWVEDACTFSVISFSNDYLVLQNIVKQVRIALEWQNDSTCHPIRLTGQNEGYNINENCFLNKLDFKTDITTI
jgi:hypothetical protein